MEPSKDFEAPDVSDWNEFEIEDQATPALFGYDDAQTDEGHCSRTDGESFSGSSLADDGEPPWLSVYRIQNQQFSMAFGHEPNPSNNTLSECRLNHDDNNSHLSPSRSSPADITTTPSAMTYTTETYSGAQGHGNLASPLRGYDVFLVDPNDPYMHFEDLADIGSSVMPATDNHDSIYNQGSHSPLEFGYDNASLTNASIDNSNPNGGYPLASPSFLQGGRQLGSARDTDRATKRRAVDHGLATSIGQRFMCNTKKCKRPGPFASIEILRSHNKAVHCHRHFCQATNCTWSFKDEKDLKRHFDSRHERKEVFHCGPGGCGREFKRKDSLSRHMTICNRIK